MSSSRFALKLRQMLYESWNGNGMPSDDLHLLSPGEVPPPLYYRNGRAGNVNEHTDLLDIVLSYLMIEAPSIGSNHGCFA